MSPFSTPDNDGGRLRRDEARGGAGSSNHREPQTPPVASRGGARTFIVRTTKSPEALVSKARRVARENGAAFKGDTVVGGFSGVGIRGSYRIEDGTVRVTITEKFGLIPWSIVKSRIKEFFG